MPPCLTARSAGGAGPEPAAPRASTSWAFRSSRTWAPSPTSWSSGPPPAGAPPRSPGSWSSGGRTVSCTRCTEAALTDQPTRYVQAARAVVAQPASFPSVVAKLFDAEADPSDPLLGAAQDVMEMTVGDVQVQVRRTAPFTATEHARANAMAALVSDVLERIRARPVPTTPGHRIGSGAPAVRRGR